MLGEQISRLKQAQSAHWQRLFSGRFDDAYFRGVQSIGLVHHKIGLEPRWYIGGYAYVLNRLTALAVRTHRWSPGKLADTLAAVNAGVMLDMDIAISVYQEALVIEKQQRAKRVDALLNGFEDKTAALVGVVASAATELEATAGAMAATTTQTTSQASNVDRGGRSGQRQCSDRRLGRRGTVGVDFRNLPPGGAIVCRSPIARCRMPIEQMKS